MADPQYEDQKENKKRPLLVISKTSFHQNTGFFVCTGITSNRASDPYLMPITDDDAVDILKERSQVMCKRIVTVRQDMILKKITRVTDTFYDKVTRKIQDDVLEI